MKSFKRWLLVLLMLCLLILSIGFSLWNTELIPLSFGVVTFSARPLSVWIVLAFSFGVLTGLLLGSGLFRHMRLRRRIEQLENELASRPVFKRVERD
jgi:uncharacterized integral membrane protein